MEIVSHITCAQAACEVIALYYKQTTMSEKKSLSCELQNLINPEPVFQDPEDDENLETANNWFNSDPDTANHDEAVPPSISKIRKKQVSFLSSLNKRYVGEKISRSHLQSDVFDKEPNEIEDDVDIEGSVDSDEPSQDDEEEGDEDDVDEEEISENEDDKSEIVGRKSDFDKVNDEEAEGILNFDSEEQISKANAVKNQLMIYENLLETRIKLQKLLILTNRLPNGENFRVIKNERSALLKELLEDCTKGVRKLGKFLLEIDRFFDSCKGTKTNGEAQSNKRKLFNLDDTNLSKRFCDLSHDYRAIIDEWHERTKFVNTNIKLKKFESFEICPTKAIDQILTDKDRLIARTRVRRSTFQIIGQMESSNNKDDVSQDDVCDEIYDDDDFYHQLLRQIIENKVSDLDDSSAITKKYAEIQRMRNKLKKQVDTKASKGRKIRYDIHEKLVNFMAPVDLTTITDEAKDELFKSLFGNFNAHALSSTSPIV